MNVRRLRTLGANALEFAKCYTKLQAALVSQGVPEDVARMEARQAALVAAVSPDMEDGETETWSDT